jgi:hypothetical protein
MNFSASATAPSSTINGLKKDIDISQWKNFNSLPYFMKVPLEKPKIKSRNELRKSLGLDNVAVMQANTILQTPAPIESTPFQPDFSSSLIDVDHRGSFSSQQPSEIKPVSAVPNRPFSNQSSTSKSSLLSDLFPTVVESSKPLVTENPTFSTKKTVAFEEKTSEKDESQGTPPPPSPASKPPPLPHHLGLNDKHNLNNQSMMSIMSDLTMSEPSTSRPTSMSVPAFLTFTLQENIFYSEKSGQIIKFEHDGKVFYSIDQEQISSSKSSSSTEQLKIFFETFDKKHFIKGFDSKEFNFITNKVNEEISKLEITPETTIPLPSSTSVLSSAFTSEPLLSYQFTDRYRPLLLKAKNKLQLNPSASSPSLQLIIQPALNLNFSYNISQLKVQLLLTPLFNKLPFTSVEAGNDTGYSLNYDPNKRILTLLNENFLPSGSNMYLSYILNFIGYDVAELEDEKKKAEILAITFPIAVKSIYEGSLLSGLDIKPSAMINNDIPIGNNEIKVKKQTFAEFRFQ